MVSAASRVASPKSRNHAPQNAPTKVIVRAVWLGGGTLSRSRKLAGKYVLGSFWVYAEYGAEKSTERKPLQSRIGSPGNPSSRPRRKSNPQ